MRIQVRRRAQEVMEAVLRGGVMPPFSAIPTLFALASDPNRYSEPVVMQLLLDVLPPVF